MPKATAQQSKRHNRDLVLHTIFAADKTSRAEIARLTGLTRTTVSEVTSGLLDEGLVEEIGRGASIGGKSPTLLRLAADSRFLIGLDLGDRKFTGAVVNLRGEIAARVEMPAASSSGAEALEAVYQLVARLLQTAHKPVVAIGAGTPGFVAASQGVVRHAVNLDWHDLPLGVLLKEKFGLPVSILNDSQAAAIGEYRYGEMRTETGNMIVVNANYGIGAGIIVHGRLFRGDHGSAGEIGHVLVRKDGASCRCGKIGCLETIASAQAILRQLSMPTMDDALQAFIAGDAQAIAAVSEAGRCLGIALANLVSTLNIHTIILNGEMTRFGSPWLASVRAAMQQTALSRLTEGVRLETGTLGRQACILGAAAALLLNDYSLLFRKAS